MNLRVTLRNKDNSSSSFGSIPENLSNSMSLDAFDNVFQQTNFPKHEAIYSNYTLASEATLFDSPGGAQTDALIAASLQETLFLLSPPSKPQPQNFSILNPSEINSSCLPLPPLPSKKTVSKRPDLIERRKLHRKEAESQRRRLIAKYAEELKQLTPKAMVRNISQEKVINSAVEFILHLQNQAIEKKKEIKQLELHISLLKAGIKC
ncbi:hypothetical protein BDR26DRAFT_854144 [Obelidium mucronatum]|nr:hypothetical protein BDR26DRAFT_854144 [Obelidium mucronatum]